MYVCIYIYIIYATMLTNAYDTIGTMHLGICKVLRLGGLCKKSLHNLSLRNQIVHVSVIELQIKV